MTFIRVFIILLVLSLPGAFIAVNALKPKECVTVSVQGLDTNYRYRDTNVQAAAVFISNLGPHVLHFDVALQTIDRSWWAHPRYTEQFFFDDGLTELQPFSRRIFHLPIPLSPPRHPWRVMVSCHRYREDLSKAERLHFLISSWLSPDIAYHYSFLSKVQPANHALHATAAAPGS